MRRAIGWVWKRVTGAFVGLWGRRRVVLSVLGVAAVVALAGVVLWWVPKWQVAHLAGAVAPEVLFQRENEARQTWAGIIGGLVVLGTLYFTWRRVEAAQRSVEVAQEGQITERFTRAIEQLGSEKLEVRLGGIYALERIAGDSEKDHWPIMEVLTTYLRRRTEGSTLIKPIPLDIQAILAVIGRRRVEFDPPEQRLDLRRTNLSGANLMKANLARANLVFARLFGADLSEANLSGGNLSGGNLSEADLSGANLSGADLPGANLSKVNLSGANLSGARLSYPGLRPANLSEAILSGADLTRADLRGANLRDAVGLTREQIESAITDETTVLPDYLKEEGEEGKGGE